MDFCIFSTSFTVIAGVTHKMLPGLQWTRTGKKIIWKLVTCWTIFKKSSNEYCLLFREGSQLLKNVNYVWKGVIFWWYIYLCSLSIGFQYINYLIKYGWKIFHRCGIWSYISLHSRTVPNNCKVRTFAIVTYSSLIWCYLIPRVILHQIQQLLASELLIWKTWDWMNSLSASELLP